MTFNEKLVKLRKLKGITQDELASAVGVSRQAVYKWESGQSYPEVPKLIEIKLLFGISIDDLLDESYEVMLPEKKVRKKRAPKNASAEENAAVKESVSVLTKEDSAPVSDFSAQEPALDAEVSRNAESEPVKAREESAAVSEEEKTEPSTEIKEENAASDKISEAKGGAEEKTEEKAEKKTEEKKRGFFARIFGR